MFDPETVKILAAFISGGLAGAIFTYFVSRQRQRVEFVVKIADKYLDYYEAIANCRMALAGPLPAGDPNEINKIRKIGDWFELVAIYYDSGYMSKVLLQKTGLLAELRKFHESVTQQKNKPESPLNDAWLWWEHLDKLVKTVR